MGSALSLSYSFFFCSFLFFFLRQAWSVVFLIVKFFLPYNGVSSDFSYPFLLCSFLFLLRFALPARMSCRKTRKDSRMTLYLLFFSLGTFFLWIRLSSFSEVRYSILWITARHDELVWERGDLRG